MTFVIVVVGLLIAAKYGWPLGVGAALLGYLGHAYAFPWAVCKHCGGNPRNSDKGGSNFNISCWWCESSGRRRRWGSRILRGGWGKL